VISLCLHVYSLNIDVFNQIIDMIVDGPKPTPKSNTEEIKIIDGTTRKLIYWI
jgi:hypothetical protein